MSVAPACGCAKLASALSCRALNMDAAWLAVSVLRWSLSAWAIWMAPSGNSVSRASRPMAMTKMAISDSIRVTAGRLMVSSPPGRVTGPPPAPALFTFPTLDHP